MGNAIAPSQPLSRTWWTAIRPFSLPASSMPIVFGTMLALTSGGAGIHLGRFLAALVGMMALHAGANLLNDVIDFRKGLDRQVHPVSGAVVRGWVTPGSALSAALVLFGVGSCLGLWLAGEVGGVVLWLGIAGLAVGVLYSWGPFPLKFHALGDLAVFLDFGILGALGAWTVQTGTISWIPVIWAVPMSLLVVGILHANNWRDIPTDSRGGIFTLASLLGDRGSAVYYAMLLIGPYLWVAGLMALSRAVGIGPRTPAVFSVVFLSLPMALQLLRQARRRFDQEKRISFLALDGATARLNLVFGGLCTAAVGLDALCGSLFL